MQEILELCRSLPEQAVDAGTVLLAEGDKTGRLYVLIEGDIEIRKGDVSIHATSEPGALFGEISALLDMPHTATVRAASACRVRVVGDAVSFLAAHPDIAFWLSKLLARRLNAVNSYLADLKRQFEDQADHLSLVDEVLATLLHQQEERFRPGSARCPDSMV